MILYYHEEKRIGKSVFLFTFLYVAARVCMRAIMEEIYFVMGKCKQKEGEKFCDRQEKSIY